MGNFLSNQSPAADPTLPAASQDGVIVDGEPFWGVDRMPMAEEWAKTGGW